jgi:hypothetical protein
MILLLKTARIPFKGELLFHKTPCCLNIIRRYSQGKIETCQNNDPNVLLKIRLPTIKKDMGRSPIQFINRIRGYINHNNSWDPTRMYIMVCSLPVIRIHHLIIKVSTNSKMPLLRANQM